MVLDVQTGSERRLVPMDRQFDEWGGTITLSKDGLALVYLQSERGGHLGHDAGRTASVTGVGATRFGAGSRAAPIPPGLGERDPVSVATDLQPAARVQRIADPATAHERARCGNCDAAMS